jgi:hypothetical protein
LYFGECILSGSLKCILRSPWAAQGIEAESPQKLRSNFEDLERKARFLHSKNAPCQAAFREKGLSRR